MKKELVTIPMVEEFARYAKLQRKMNKVEEEILAKGQSRMDRRESIQTKWTRNFQIVNVTTKVLSFLFTEQNFNSFLSTQGPGTSLFINYPAKRASIFRPNWMVLAI